MIAIPTVPLYIVAGEEPLLAQQSVDQIRRHLRSQGYTREIYDVDSHFSWEQLEGLAQTRSLFSQKQLLELRITTAKVFQTGLTALRLHTAVTQTECVILAWVQEDVAIHTLKNLPDAYTALSRRLTTGQFRSWLQRQISLTPEAIDFVLRYYEGNLLAANQLVNKLHYQWGKEQKITLAQVQDLAHDNARYDMFEVIDGAFAGDTALIPRHLAHLAAESTAPLLLLGIFMKNVREFLQMRLAIDHGTPISKAISDVKIWTRRIPLIQAALQRHTYAEALQWIIQAAAIEVAVKQGDPTVWQQFETLLLQVSEKTPCILAS